MTLKLALVENCGLSVSVSSGAPNISMPLVFAQNTAAKYGHITNKTILEVVVSKGHATSMCDTTVASDISY